MKLNAFFSGFIKIHILHHAARGPVFGLEIIKELSRHGYEVSPGTVYPLLHKLEKEGFLRSEGRGEQGKPRRYYRATASGRAALEEIRPKLRELVDEVLGGEEPADV